MSSLLASKASRYSLRSLRLTSLQPFKKGDKISDIEGTFAGPKKYTSVQKGKDDHFEVRSSVYHCQRR